MITISNRRILTQTDDKSYIDGRPCFDPSGTLVLFERSGGGLSFAELWTVPLASPGTESTYYSSSEHDCFRPAWSWNPDQTERQIAFTGLNYPVYTINADPNCFDEQKLNVHGHERANLSYPAWYPNSDLLIANYSIHKLIKADLAGAFLGVLTNAEFSSGMGTVNRADTDTIAYAGQRTRPGVHYNQDNNRIWLQNGSDQPQMVSPEGSGQIGRAPWFTPDGQYIGYENYDADNIYQVWIQELVPVNEPLQVQPVQISVGATPSQHVKFSPDGSTAVWAQGGRVHAADIAYS